MKELIRTLKQETYQYRDPITEFVLCLYSEYNFDRAHEMLVRCQEVMERDYFLCHWRDSFVQNARQVIFEMYCRLHSAIDIRVRGCPRHDLLCSAPPRSPVPDGDIEVGHPRSLWRTS